MFTPTVVLESHIDVLREFRLDVSSQTPPGLGRNQR